jgi:hypothetical protein
MKSCCFKAGLTKYNPRLRSDAPDWFYFSYTLYKKNFSFSSFLGSTAQLRPWPPPQNPAEFLGGFSTIFFFTGYGC